MATEYADYLVKVPFSTRASTNYTLSLNFPRVAYTNTYTTINQWFSICHNSNNENFAVYGGTSSSSRCSNTTSIFTPSTFPTFSFVFNFSDFSDYDFADPLIYPIISNDDGTCSVDFTKPVDIDNSSFSDLPIGCQPNANTRPVAFYSQYTVKVPYTVPDSGGSSGSSDYSDIVNAILVCPATLIVISFFICIYKIFINRRLRG